VRVWKDYTSNEFVDNVTNFNNLRFLRNGMVFSIAVVPKGDDIPKPESVARLAALGVIGGSTGTTVPGDTTVPGSTVPGDTTVPGSTVPGDTGASTTVAGSTTTTGG
jgi:hypothetical protein